MKNLVKTIAILVAIATFGVAAAAQGPKLRIDSLDRLEDTAAKVVDISLDEKLMGMAAKILSKAETNDPDAQKVAKVIAGIKEIHIRSYEFDAPGAYTQADVESIRSQLKSPGWDRLVGVRNKRDGKNAEVYMLTQGQEVLGVAILVAEEKELTVVNIIGSVDIEQLGELELDTDLGIPRIELERSPKPSGN